MNSLSKKLSALFLALILVGCSPSSDAVATYVVQTIEAASAPTDSNSPTTSDTSDASQNASNTSAEEANSPAPTQKLTKDDAANFDGLLRFLPVDPNNILPLDFVITQYSEQAWGDGWVNGSMDIFLINFHTEPVMPMSIDIYSGYVETEEGNTYEATIYFDGNDSLPITIKIDPLAGQTLPALLPIVDSIRLGYKFAEASSPTRLMLNTSLGDVYIDLSSNNTEVSSLRPDILLLSYARQQTRPIEELLDHFVFEITGSEQVQFTIDKTCIVKKKNDYGFKYSLTNNNSLDEETVFLSVTRPTHYLFDMLENSQYIFWWADGNTLSIPYNFNLEKAQDVPVTIGPGQTVEGIYSMYLKDWERLYFYVLPQESGRYNLYEPLHFCQN